MPTCKLLHAILSGCTYEESHYYRRPIWGKTSIATMPTSKVVPCHTYRVQCVWMDLLQDITFAMVRLWYSHHNFRFSYADNQTGNASPNKWIIHLEGASWCFNEDECVERSKGPWGSSNLWPLTLQSSSFLSGFLSDDCTVNPDFCGWSLVYVKYCDGASFAGNM